MNINHFSPIAIHAVFPICSHDTLRKYFESIDHQILKSLLKQVFKDKNLLELMDIIINHKTPNNFLEKGLPIGNLTSQHFANFYLGELDHFIKDQSQIKGYVRYMDDFISFSNDKEDLQKLLVDIREFVNKNLKLELKEKVTTIAPVSEGIPFLGFRVFPQIIRIKRENLIQTRNPEKLKLNTKLFNDDPSSRAKLATGRVVVK